MSTAFGRPLSFATVAASVSWCIMHGWVGFSKTRFVFKMRNKSWGLEGYNKQGLEQIPLEEMSAMWECCRADRVCVAPPRVVKMNVSRALTELAPEMSMLPRCCACFLQECTCRPLRGYHTHVHIYLYIHICTHVHECAFL